MWLWGTTINNKVSDASQGSMYAKFEESEAKKAAKPKPSPWVTIGNIEAEVPMSSAGKTVHILLNHIKYSPKSHQTLYVYIHAIFHSILALGLPVTGAGAKAEGTPGFDFDVLTQKPFRRNDIVDAEKEDKMDDVSKVALNPAM